MASNNDSSNNNGGGTQTSSPVHQQLEVASAQDRLYLFCRRILADHEESEGRRPPAHDDLQQLAFAVSCLARHTGGNLTRYSDNPSNHDVFATTTAQDLLDSPSPASSPMRASGTLLEQQQQPPNLLEGNNPSNLLATNDDYYQRLPANDEQESEPLLLRSSDSSQEESHSQPPVALLPNDEENPDSALLVRRDNNNNHDSSSEIPNSGHSLRALRVLIVVLSFCFGWFCRDLVHSLFLSPSTTKSINDRESMVHSCAAVLSGLEDVDVKMDSSSNSPQYRAAEWFLGPHGSNVTVPTTVDIDSCHWDSTFGMLYALLVVRESLAVQAWDDDDNDDDHHSLVPQRVCHWPGIKCNDEGQIKNLILNHAQLEGSLPAELAGLVHLEKFHAFSNPHLTGTIPTQLGSLSRLESLQLHETGLTGSVPREICQLRESGNLAELLVDASSVACSCCH